MNGIILIDKEKYMTSRDVVNKLIPIFNTKKIGHTGTLDPLATGVLAVCIGKATKISELITSYDKEYIAEITLGITTDTLDMDGIITKEVDNVDVETEEILKVINNFQGKIEQEVPLYSAIKVAGKKLYEYARSGIEVQLPKREIEIYDIALIDDLIKDNGKVIFKIKCHVSKGAYIRSLVRDIGLSLGYPACMSSLRRIKQGSFKIEDCYTLNDIKNNNYKVLSIRDVLSNIEEIIVNKELEFKIRNGSIIDKIFNNDLAKIINEDGELIAIYKKYDKDDKKAKPYVMF